MKVKAHILVRKGYHLGMACSQWRSELEEKAERANQEWHTPGDDEDPQNNSDYLNHDRTLSVVTVEFDVPDEVFKRTPPPVIAGEVKP